MPKSAYCAINFAVSVVNVKVVNVFVQIRMLMRKRSVLSVKLDMISIQKMERCYASMRRYVQYLIILCVTTMGNVNNQILGAFVTQILILKAIVRIAWMVFITLINNALVLHVLMKLQYAVVMVNV